MKSEQNVYATPEPALLVPTLKLSPDLTKPGAILLFSLLFWALGFRMVQDGHQEGWFLLTLFTLSSFACLSVILPGACYLEINHEGITVASSFRRKTYRWDQIERMGIFEIGMIRRVGVDLNKNYHGPERVPKQDKSASGYHLALPVMKGVELEQLLEVMSECHQAHVLQRTA